MLTRKWDIKSFTTNEYVISKYIRFAHIWKKVDVIIFVEYIWKKVDVIILVESTHYSVQR